MKLNYDKRSKDPTYFIQQGIRNGSKTTTRNVARIGKHSELLQQGIKDPLSYAKEQVIKYNEEFAKSKVTMDVTVRFDEKIRTTDDAVSKSTVRNVGYLYLQEIYHGLKIGTFLKTITKDRRIEFNPNLVWRFLAVSRILRPESKLATHRHRDRYYEQPEFGYEHIHRTMDLLEEHYDEYIAHLYDQSSKLVHIDSSVCFYDCTNYYFEIESPDDDYVDEVTGEFIKGFRKYGVSKENRPLPLVEMGLFIDRNGIPLSMCVVSGSDNEQTTALPLEKKLVQMLHGNKFIYCADSGLGSYHIRNYNSMNGRAFVITQSIKKLSQTLKDAVFNDCDYRLLSTDKPVSLDYMKSFDRFDENLRPLYEDKIYKIIPADNLIDLGLYEEKKLKNGKTQKVKVKGTLKQNLIITFSRKLMEYQRFIRNRQISRAIELLNNMDPDTYKKGPHDVTRFIKKASKSGKELYVLDQKKIRDEEQYDGFYAIATNLDDDVKTILEINSGRQKIEESFRIIKSNFLGRPVYHRSREHIIAHFMICYTALLIYRILERKLEEKDHHFTSSNIIEQLQNMNVTNYHDIYYTAAYTGSQLLTALGEISDLELDRKNYLPKDLNKYVRKFSK